MKNLLICGNAKKALKLNESESESGRYILEGLFAGPFGVENRNKRIYQVDEYLKHLQYLRDDIKKGEPLLGELDHPEDRFEVKLKDVSHRILDIWYDKASNTIQGKIELLNTPNGKLAQSLVDQGIPLHISSRAAGTVNSDKSVCIQQIYTFDLVCKPGFAGAVLHRVNESEDAKKYSDDVYEFLSESERIESLNAAPQFGMINEDVSITEVSSEIKLRDEAKKIQENNSTDNMTSDENIKNGLQECGTNDLSEKDDDETQDEKDTEKDTDDTESTDNDEKDESGDDEDKGVEIISVRAETGSGDVEIEGVKAGNDESDEESDDEEKSDDEESEDNEDSDDEDEKKDESESDDQENECCGKDKDKEMLLDCDKIEKRREKFEDKFDELIDAIKNKGDKKKADESYIINKYPNSKLLNENNFAEFMQLDESQKRNVINYLQDNKIYTIENVNESWRNGINYDVNEEVWLKFAPANYKELYENADESVRESIRNTASFVLFEHQSDINRFWENTGLYESSRRNVLNENFINSMPKIVAEKEEPVLPYSNDFIKSVTEMACEYN